MDRRSFFKISTSFAACASILSGRVFAASSEVRLPSAITPLGDEQTIALRNELLAMVNRERQSQDLGPLRFDDLASQVATGHAQDMADGAFISHWGRDGRKPYQRYSFAGGTDAIEENDGSVDHSNAFVTSEEFVDDVLEAHRSMFAESAPNDGHRKTILGPQHTHVGFGIASRYGHVRLSEIYVARYIAVDVYPRVRPPRTKFLFSGRVLQPTYTVQSVDVFYEELPSPPTIEWLRVVRSYGLPEQRTTLLPRLPENTFYDNGSRGSIEFSDRGRFKVHVPLGKLSGIYTLVAWLQQGESKPFPATQVCIRVE